jgi:hypothetical protein
MLNQRRSWSAANVARRPTLLSQNEALGGNEAKSSQKLVERKSLYECDSLAGERRPGRILFLRDRRSQSGDAPSL